jgi:hypothetical protein
MNQITRRERRNDVSGELLPALPEDVTPQRPPIFIRLPDARPAETGLLEHTIQKPARTPSFESDFIVPAAQALLSAIVAAIVTGLLAWCLDWNGKTVPIAFGVTLAVTWLWRMRVSDALLWQFERLVGHDVNHDGVIGQPGTVLVNPWQARQEAAQVVADDDAQHERQELTAFLHRCYTVGCSESAHGVKASGPDRETYVKNRDVLFALGIASWRNPERPKAGWRLAVSHAKAVDLLSKYTL